MPTALFYNFSDYPFTGRWNSEDMTFAPKEKRYMPAFLAQHFAKHLTNRELHRQGLDYATSPKNPEDQPEFDKLFRIAYQRDRDLPGQKRNTLKDMVDSVHLNRTAGDPGLRVSSPKSELGPDVEAKPQPRVPAPEEDPNFTRESDTVPVDGAPGALGKGNAPQIVTPPDFNDDEEDGFEGVPVTGTPETPAPTTSSAPAPVTAE